ncbi:MAG: ATP-binding cassette domain-containing protein [Stenotrophomonas sp.]
MTVDFSCPDGEQQLPGGQIDFVDWGIQLGRRTILTGINLSIRGPGITVVMGPGGTGKSTLLKTLAGLHSAHGSVQGSIQIDGQPLHTLAGAPPALAQQHPRELDFSLLDSLVAAQRVSGMTLSPAQMRQRALDALQHYGLTELLDKCEQRLFDLPRELMRCAMIVRAVLTGSQILLIDEPTSELDAGQSERVLQLIRQLGGSHTCLVVLHNQQQARQIADHLVLLAGGRVQVACDNAGFFANPDNHPVLAQFLRTGSCHVAAPDSRPEDLEAGYDNMGGIATEPAAVTAPPAAPATTPPLAVNAPAPIAMTPADGNAASLTRDLGRPDTLPPGVLPASRGPTGFHWLVPGKLAGCPMPGAMLPLEHDLALLRNVGITVLINLTERPMTQTAIPAAGLRTLHMSVVDRHAPPLMWMKMLLVKIERLLDQGEVVAVHCLAGLGRTGTVLGSWLVRQGLTAEESLRRLRAIEPGFVQSAVQEQLLHELEINLLIRAPDL